MLCEVHRPGPVNYIGQDMKTSPLRSWHNGRRLAGSCKESGHLLLISLKCRKKKIDELLAIVAGLRPVIVEL